MGAGVVADDGADAFLQMGVMSFLARPGCFPFQCKLCPRDCRVEHPPGIPPELPFLYRLIEASKQINMFFVCSICGGHGSPKATKLDLNELILSQDGATVSHHFIQFHVDP